MVEEVLKKPGFWSVYGPNNDVVLSSRIRLARNIETISFPNRFFDNELYIIALLLEKFSHESKYSSNITILDLNKIDSNEKRLLRERNIITYEMEISNNSLVVIDNFDDFNILINDEDHFRIQVIRPGLQLLDAYRLSENVDDELNKFTSYAYSNDYGYLTACPSNLGTGLKASVILHLPAITMSKKINDIIQDANKNDIEIKGTIGNSQRTLSGLYQISNKVSLGLSEIDIIEMMDDMVNNIIVLEDNERDDYLSSSKSSLEDKIWRSFGLLKYSRRISYVEAMEHLSNIRLGVILAVIRNYEIVTINDLMVNIQWSHLQRNFKQNFKSTTESDEYRADYIRMILQ